MLIEGKIRGTVITMPVNVRADGAVYVVIDTAAITPAHTYPDVNGNTLVLEANSARTYALFINDSDTVIYLSLDGAAQVNSGIRLNANGGSYEMSTAQGNLSVVAVYAIHGGVGDKRLLITEGT